MKFQTTAGLLSKALSTVAPVIERRSTIPVLSCVRFDGRTITGTDLDMELSVNVPATLAKGAACIAHRPLAGLMRHVPVDDTVTIRAGKDEADVTFSSGRYTLPCLSADDFPDITRGDQTEVEIDADQFLRAMAFASNFVSTEETRYYLNGVCLDGDVAVATNGHQLGCAPLGKNSGTFSGGIVPRKAVGLIGKLPGLTGVTVNREKLSVIFTAPGIVLRTKLIDGTFPDWRRVVPADSDATSTVSVPRISILAAVNRLCGMRGKLVGGSVGATLAWDANNLAIAAKSYVAGGTMREFVVPRQANGMGQISFNMAYLRQVLRAIGDEEISFSTKDEGSPCIFRGKGRAYAVIMPLCGADSDIATAALDEMRLVSEIEVAA